MELLPPQEQGKLEHTAQVEMLKKNMAMQAASAKKLAHLYIPNTNFKNMTRLQARSYPLGCEIIIDGTHTNEITPKTFDNLTEGKHLIQLDYVVPETGQVVSKKEEVDLIKGKRTVVKQYFKKPKTLAERSELSNINTPG